MDRKTMNRILDVQEMAMEDAVYKELLTELRICNVKLENLYATLTKEQVDILMDYLGIGAELHLRLLEIACSDND